MCLYSRLVPNPKYKITAKNGGIIPPVSDERVKYVPIGCGECMECRKDKARQWQVRLLEDIKTNTNGKFVTLTFSDESIKKMYEYVNSKNEIKLEGYDMDNAIATSATRLWLERWRKKYKKSIRHWLVTELGHVNTENVHLHGIVWTNEHFDMIRETWQYGYVYPRNAREINKNYVNAKTVNYIIKYVTKIDEDHKYYKSIVLTSDGIGRNYTNSIDSRKHKYIGATTIETYRTATGHKMKMPIYWRNKMFSEEEREKLWLHKLDKQQLYVMGNKIDISKGYDEYYKILKYYRARNKELGYGDDETNHDLKEWEKQQRNLKLLARINRAEEKETLGAGLGALPQTPSFLGCMDSWKGDSELGLSPEGGGPGELTEEDYHKDYVRRMQKYLYKG